jgi:hypothetical protein
VAARGLLSAQQVDWPDWRRELSESVAGSVGDKEIGALPAVAHCFEAPSSAVEMAAKFPEHFLEELSNRERRNDYRTALAAAAGR